MEVLILVHVRNIPFVFFFSSIKSPVIANYIPTSTIENAYYVQCRYSLVQSYISCARSILRLGTSQVPGRIFMMLVPAIPIPSLFLPVTLMRSTLSKQAASINYLVSNFFTNRLKSLAHRANGNTSIQLYPEISGVQYLGYSD